MNVRQLMFADLESRLNNREVLSYPGEDAESVVYCSKRTLDEGISEIINLAHRLDHVGLDHAGLDEIKSELNLDTSKKYFKLVENEDTGYFYSYSSNTVEGLCPEIQTYSAIQELALDKGEITEDEVVFADDCDPLAKISENISDETFVEVSQSSCILLTKR